MGRAYSKTAMSENDDAIAHSHLALNEKIRRRAHEIWLSRKHAGGEDAALEDWLQAEQEILGKDEHSSAQSRGTTVGPAYAPGRALTDDQGTKSA
jgi:hypothetical protein